MWEDPIVKEVREEREAHAAQFNYNLEAIFQDIKRQEEASGRTFVTFSPRPAKPLPRSATKDATAAADEPEVVSVEQVMREISEKAQARGLTEEELDELL